MPASAGWRRSSTSSGKTFTTAGGGMDEIVQVLKALWTQEEPEFHGRFYDFGPVRFDPKPGQPRAELNRIQEGLERYAEEVLSRLP